MTPVATATHTRPRVEGDRETEIFEAVLRLLVETGYDKLTFDLVATEVRASKATLYRKWPTKADLVVEAVVAQMCGLDTDDAVDAGTGSLRDDLLGGACEDGGLTSVMPGLMSALMPALQRDAELFAAVQERFFAPKRLRSLAMFTRAQARGELGPDADLELLMTILPSMCIHSVVLGHAVTRDDVIAIIDGVVLPACRATLTTP